MNQSELMDWKKFYSHQTDLYSSQFLNIKLTFLQRVYLRFISKFKSRHLGEIKLDKTTSIIFGRRNQIYFVTNNEDGSKIVV